MLCISTVCSETRCSRKNTTGSGIRYYCINTTGLTPRCYYINTTGNETICFYINTTGGEIASSVKPYVPKQHNRE
jgi:hypothetical protein